MGLSDNIQEGQNPFSKAHLPNNNEPKDSGNANNTIEPTSPTWQQGTMLKLKLLWEKLSHSPLFGTLLLCSKNNYIDASIEFGTLLVWATMPFWLGGLVHYAVSVKPNKDLCDLIVGTFRNGELLVFVISVVTPTLYLVNKPDQEKSFPHALFLSTIVIVIIVVSAVMFSLQKSGVTLLDVDFIFQLSVILTISGLTLRYLALVYHRYRMPVPNEKQMRQGQKNFVDEFAAHRGVENG